MAPRRFSARHLASMSRNAARNAALAAAAASRNPDKMQLWKGAIKAPMYTVAVTPVLVSSCAWCYETGTLSLPTVLHFLLAAILIIAWLNICNDVFDHATGIDKNKRESLVNLLGGSVFVRYSLLFFAKVLLAAAFVSIRWIAYNTPAGNRNTVVSLMGIAVFAGYAYQGPPFRLGYLGCGEFICYTAWSIAMSAMFYAQSPDTNNNNMSLYQAIRAPFPSFIPFSSVSASVSSPSHSKILPAAASLVALPTTLILLTSHFHQKDDDLNAGKLSPIVRLGTRKAASLVRLLAALFLWLHLAYWYMGIIPRSCALLGLLAGLPNTIRLRGFIRDYHDKPAVVRSAKYIVVRMHFVHGIALSAAFYYAAWNRHGSITFT